jgi:hypothetical protein
MPYACPIRRREAKRAEARLAYVRAYNIANRDTIREQARAYKARTRAEHRDRANAMKLASGCVDSGRADDPRKLDLEDFVPSDMVQHRGAGSGDSQTER